MQKEAGKLSESFCTLPKHRQEIVKWNGWGYKDSGFEGDPESRQIWFNGERYGGTKILLPKFPPWVESTFSCSVYEKIPVQPEPKESDIDPPVMNADFVAEMKELHMDHSFLGRDRLYRAHGQTLKEIYTLRHGKFPRIPDVVIWPKCHEDVVKIVQLADKHNVVVIPFGGGTNVTGAIECREGEERMIVSLDTSQMNKIHWVNKVNNTALVEAGVVGKDLEERLAKDGLCVGHVPDSYEFSTVGGWVATRASGMKKNVYGNMEDIVVNIKVVTPRGVIQKNCQVPRLSSGPDIHHFILGSEGTLGVVTEVIIKVKPLPSFTKFGSILFPNFESGVACLKEIVRQGLLPASFRLMDNEQLKFGQALKRGSTSLLGPLSDHLKEKYITLIKRFDMQKVCFATILLEGDKKDVLLLERKIYNAAKKFQGLPAGVENGSRGYLLTFLIAYIRDFAFDFGVIAGSFETSVPWDRVLDLSRNVKDRIRRELKAYGLRYEPFVTCRVTQSYDVGACVYFYFAFNQENLEDPVDTADRVEAAARDEIISSGGSISHHHGVGKIRKKWFVPTVSVVGVGMLKAVKQYLDPKNIFANGNLFDYFPSNL